MRIDQPGIRKWQIPVDRQAFEQLALAYSRSDEAAIERWSEATAWLIVEHGQAVRVAQVQADAIQVELLDGHLIGRRGWVRRRHLAS
jgi:hypothetical protein